ncbi:MAG: RteC domain-containing protein [Bacteroidota bacterium]
MQNKIAEIISKFKEEIKVIEQGNLNDFAVVERGIQLSRSCVQQLRLVVRDNKFNSIKEEIYFFKHQKPFVYSRIKFYSKLYHFLLERPAGSSKRQRDFIDSCIEKLQNSSKRNLDFVKYYREGDTTLDHHYFLRGNDNLSLVSDTSHFYTDAEFSTSHDNIMAKVMAYDLLVAHYNKELVELGHAIPKEKRINICAELDLKWTSTKTDLVELIYALQASGAIKDGSAGIRDMVAACEQMFNIDLGQYYKTYVEIRARKMNRTSFINMLKLSLEKRMRQDDEKN